MMDKGYSDNSVAADAAAHKPRRYNFELPYGLTVSELLAIQLADCVNIVQSLSDDAKDRRLQDVERLHTIHSLETVVNASTKLGETIDRLQDNPEPVFTQR